MARAERKVVVKVCVEIMPAVVTGISALHLAAIRLWSHAWIVLTAITKEIVDGMRPSVIRLELQSFCQPASVLCLHGVIDGIVECAAHGKGSQCRILPRV